MYLEAYARYEQLRGGDKDAKKLLVIFYLFV